MTENPLQCVRKLVKFIGGGTEPKREIHVHKILSLPINPQEMPVVGVNGDETKGRLQVGFGHEGPRAQGFKDANGIVHLNVLKGVRVFGNEIIDASPFRV